MHPFLLHCVLLHSHYCFRLYHPGTIRFRQMLGYSKLTAQFKFVTTHKAAMTGTCFYLSVGLIGCGVPALKACCDCSSCGI